MAAAPGVRVISVTGEVQRPAENPNNLIVGDFPYRVNLQDALDAVAAAEGL
jgi:hypothetical protein